MTTTITRDDKIKLGKLTTHNESGQHFMQIHDAEWIDRMVAAGYVTLHTPEHPETKLPYPMDCWTVEVSDEVSDWFDGSGNLID